MFYTNETLALFVDGWNFHATTRALGIDVDFGRLKAEFQGRGRLLRASYFTLYDDSEDHVRARPLLDWLEFNGWSVFARPKRTDDDFQKQRGSVEIEMAVAAMKMARHIDHAVIFTGNAAFIPLVAFLQEQGTRVTIASSIEPETPAASNQLRRQTDAFIELDKLRDRIARLDRATADA